MNQTFECPNCGASIDYYDPAKPTVRCVHCGTTVIVPEELRAQAPQAPTVDLAPAVPGDTAGADTRGWLRWAPAFIILFVLCTVIIPLIGAFVGVGSALFGISQVFSNTGNVQSTIVASVTELPEATDTLAPTPSPTPGFASVALTFGSAGTGPGRFTDARNIALDANGDIYVGEYVGGRIQVFDSSGKFITQWNVGDSKTDLFGLAADRKGTVYAVGDGTIFRYNGATGKALGAIQYPGGDTFGAVTTTADGGLLAMWYQARFGLITSLEGHREDLVQFDGDGKLVGTIPSLISSQTGEVETDTLLAVDGQGNIFALGGLSDYGVFRFSPEGKFVNKFGSTGSEPGQFEGVGALAVDGQSRIYVGDTKGIQVFDPNGRYLDLIAVPVAVRSMAFDDNNDLWVAASDRILKLVLNAK